ITTDVAERFSIDDRRTYATGFSGGARIALFFAARCNDCLAGVIASGAGFPSSITPDSSMHFSIFAAVGHDDFNFAEVKNLEEPLAKSRIPHRIETFAGRHDWLPSSLAVKAVEWMELQAIKGGRRDRNEPFIEAAWQNNMQEARGLEAAKNPFAAF